TTSSSSDGDSPEGYASAIMTPSGRRPDRVIRSVTQKLESAPSSTQPLTEYSRPSTHASTTTTGNPALADCVRASSNAAGSCAAQWTRETPRCPHPRDGLTTTGKPEAWVKSTASPTVEQRAKAGTAMPAVE